MDTKAPRRIVAGLFTSLDGVVEGPERWGFPYMTASMSKHIGNGIAAADIVLLGPHTYALFAQLWADQPDSSPMAKFLNGSMKYVASRQPVALPWGPAERLGPDTLEAVAALKRSPGRTIQVPGSPRLVGALAVGLLDALNLIVVPKLVGTGARLYDGSVGMLDLTLVGRETFETGAVSLAYAAAAARTDAVPQHFRKPPPGRCVMAGERPDAARLQLFGLPQSNFVRAVRIVLAEKQADYDFVPAMPHSPEVCALNPVGRIPAMRHGPVALGESEAMVAYLDRLLPDPLMGPSGTAEEAAEIQQWTSAVATAIDPIFIRRYLFAHMFPEAPDGSVDREAIDAALPKLHSLADVLDRRLEGRRFLAAGRFTFADALLLPTLAGVASLPEGSAAVAVRPNLLRYLEEHSRRDSFVATHPG